MGYGQSRNCPIQSYRENRYNYIVKNITRYCTIYITRHGETEWNTKKLIQGHKDSPLTQNGIDQARQTAKKLQKINFDEVFSSDLRRAHNTAKIITEERNLAIKTTKLLREKDFGKYSGKEYTIFQNELKNYLNEFESLPDEEKKKYKYPTSESDEEVINRFIRFLREVAVGYPNKTVLVVTHAGLIGNLLIHLGMWKYSDQYKTKIDNAGYLKLISDGIDFFIKDANGIEINP